MTCVRDLASGRSPFVSGPQARRRAGQPGPDNVVLSGHAVKAPDPSTDNRRDGSVQGLVTALSTPAPVLYHIIVIGSVTSSAPVRYW
jgi:hypothetical protein